MALKKSDIIEQLRGDILRMEGFKSQDCHHALDTGLGPIRNAFPNSVFPLGAVHEFLSASMEDATAAKGFISGLLAALMGKSGTALWISVSRKLFPPALKTFGLEPDRFIFIDLQKERHALWAMEEALKCSAISAVVGEIQKISFTESRRFQLAVENSQVTGFIVRRQLRDPGTTACVSRWRISTLPSEPVDGLPGIGFPQWKVELLRIRNGKPGAWDVRWANGKFEPVIPPDYVALEKKTG